MAYQIQLENANLQYSFHLPDQEVPIFSIIYLFIYFILFLEMSRLRVYVDDKFVFLAEMLAFSRCNKDISSHVSDLSKSCPP